MRLGWIGDSTNWTRDCTVPSQNYNNTWASLTSPIAYCMRTASLLKYYYNRGLTGGIQEVLTFSMTRIIQESALMVTMLDYHNT